MRTISGAVSSTPIEWLSALCDIIPADIRRRNNLLALYRKTASGGHIPLKTDFDAPILQRLKSRRPAIATAKTLSATDFNPKEFWKERWLNTGRGNELFNFDDHSARSKEFLLPRKLWCNLNRIRTGHGRCNEMLYKWKMIDDPSCTCGNPHLTIPLTFNVNF